MVSVEEARYEGELDDVFSYFCREWNGFHVDRGGGDDDNDNDDDDDSADDDDDDDDRSLSTGQSGWRPKQGGEQKEEKERTKGGVAEEPRRLYLVRFNVFMLRAPLSNPKQVSKRLLHSQQCPDPSTLETRKRRRQKNKKGPASKEEGEDQRPATSREL
jgi:hypothetical protein